MVSSAADFWATSQLLQIFSPWCSKISVRDQVRLRRNSVCEETTARLIKISNQYTMFHCASEKTGQTVLLLRETSLCAAMKRLSCPFSVGIHSMCLVSRVGSSHRPVTPLFDCLRSSTGTTKALFIVLLFGRIVFTRTVRR